MTKTETTLSPCYYCGAKSEDYCKGGDDKGFCRWTRVQTPTTAMTLEDRNGRTHVLLSCDGDHIVTKLDADKRGDEIAVMLAAGSFTWERAVDRTQRAAVFL
jgi:hypothetical protein